MRFTELDIKSDIKLNDYYNKRIVISHSDGKPLRFQIPRLYMPFGLSGFTPEMGPTKWNIDFSMKGWNEEDNYIKKFYFFLKQVEEHVCNFVKENKIEIFGTQNVDIENIFNSNIKEDTNNGREPKFRVKVDADQSNLIKPKIFDNHENDVTTVATRGLYARQTGVALVELTSVYFLNKKFGLTWKVCQLKVYEPQRLHGFQFDIPDDEDDEKMKGFQFQV